MSGHTAFDARLPFVFSACFIHWVQSIQSYIHGNSVVVLVIHAVVNLPKLKTQNLNLCHQFPKKIFNTLTKARLTLNWGHTQAIKTPFRQKWVCFAFLILVLLCRGFSPILGKSAIDFGKICQGFWGKTVFVFGTNWFGLGENWFGFWVGSGQSSSLTSLGLDF